MKTSIFILLGLNNFLDFIIKEAQNVDRIHIVTPVESLEYTEDYLGNLLPVETKVTISTNVKIKNQEKLISCIDPTATIEHIFAFEEYCLLSAAYLRQYFKIYGKKPEDVITFRDKKLMIDVLENSGINSVKIPYTEDYIDYRQVVRLLKKFKKVIAKRKDGMGSKDMAIFTSDLSDLEVKGLAENIRKDKSYIIQEFIEGQVFHYDTFVINKTPIINNLMMYQENQFEFKSNKSLSAVSVSDSQLRDKLIDAAHEVIACYGMDKVTLHLELINSVNGIYFCEIGVRPGGAGVVPVIESLFGTNLFEVEYNLQSNREELIPNEIISQVNQGGWTIVYPKKGKVTFVSDVDEILKLDGVKSADVYIKAGDSLGLGKHCATKVFQSVYTAENIDDVLSLKDKILNEFKFETE